MDYKKRKEKTAKCIINLLGHDEAGLSHLSCGPSLLNVHVCVVQLEACSLPTKIYYSYSMHVSNGHALLVSNSEPAPSQSFGHVLQYELNWPLAAMTLSTQAQTLANPPWPTTSKTFVKMFDSEGEGLNRGPCRGPRTGDRGLHGNRGLGTEDWGPTTAWGLRTGDRGPGTGD